MTIFDLQDELIAHFKTLNEASGKTLLKDNVAYPNEAFTKPSNKTWYEIHFLHNDKENVGMAGSESQDRYNDIMQIDICTPLDKGNLEAANKYKALAELFSKGTEIGDDILVEKCWLSSQIVEDDVYRSQMRIRWTADVDKE